MRFDARAAAKLPSGDHMTFEGFPGLRLQASTNRKSWTYRYKSPVDSRMRQVKLGEWPAMSFANAIAAWEEPCRAKLWSRALGPASTAEERGYSLIAGRLHRQTAVP